MGESKEDIMELMTNLRHEIKALEYTVANLEFKLNKFMKETERNDYTDDGK